MDIENEYGTLEQQQYLLPILIDIDKFCRDNNINYSLSDGTLLGAVRHKGFIPWDDDIDISLDRDNFDKFLKAVERLPEKYEIIYDLWIRRITRKDNPNKHVFPPKGCIDLFVFDRVPDRIRTEKIQVFLLRLLQGMIKKNVVYDGFSLQKKVLLFTTHIFGKFFPANVKKKWYDSVSQWGNNGKKGNVARYNGSYKGIGNARYPSEILDKYVNIQFENHTFMAMGGWDKFLSVMYGDYMKIPKKQDRKTSHEHIGAKT